MKKNFQLISFILLFATFTINTSSKKVIFHEAGHATILHENIKKGLPCKIECIELAEKIGITSSKGRVQFSCDFNTINRDPKLGRMLAQVLLGGGIGEEIPEKKEIQSFHASLNSDSTLDDRVQALEQATQIRKIEAFSDMDKMDEYMQTTQDKNLQYLANLQIMHEEYNKAIQIPNLKEKITTLATHISGKEKISGEEIKKILK
ncbi:MAG: hypothetical protein ACXWL5_03635 [Candidatus Chromulinivorax sp.]